MARSSYTGPASAERQSPSERLHVRWTEQVAGDVAIPSGVVVFPPPVAITLNVPDCRVKRTRAPWRAVENAEILSSTAPATGTSTKSNAVPPRPAVDAATYRVLAPLVGEERLDDSMQRREIAPGLKIPERDDRNPLRALYPTDYIEGGKQTQTAAGQRWKADIHDMLRRTNTRLRQDHLNDALQEHMDVLEVLIDRYPIGTTPTKASLLPLFSHVFSIFRLMILAKSDEKGAAKADTARRKLLDDYNKNAGRN